MKAIVTSYEERKIHIEGSDVSLLIDFITANLAALTEGEILELENLQVGDTAYLGKVRIERIW